MMDKILFIGVGDTGARLTEKINEELSKRICSEDHLQTHAIVFNDDERAHDASMPEVPRYDLNDMDMAKGNGFTSRRGVEDYREVAEKLKDEIREIIAENLKEK